MQGKCHGRGQPPRRRSNWGLFARRWRPDAGCLALLATLALAGCGQPADPEPTTPATRCGVLPLAHATAIEDSIAFQGSVGDPGADGYPVFRIPSVVTTASGVLVAFAEGRPSLLDPGSGQIDLVMKRSVDCGRTWSVLQVLADNGTGDAHNPVAVVVPQGNSASRLWIFYAQRPVSAGGELDIAPGLGSDSDTLWTRVSDDDGQMWSPPRDLTADVKDATWGIIAPGPGRGIVTRWGRDGVAAGRIVVPGWHTVGTQTGSFVFYSEDDGNTWHRGGLPTPGTDESQVVERTDGTLLLDGRQGDKDPNRKCFLSHDGGQTWSGATPGLAMVPVMSSVVRISASRDGQDRDRLLHTGVSPTSRADARVWLSHDEGATWDHETVLVPGFAQYTVATVLDDATVGMAYESLGTDAAGVTGFNVHFTRFSLAVLGE
jgi:sialidase-1